MTHLEQRLQERNIVLKQVDLLAIAAQYKCAAVILAKGEHKGTSEGNYYSRTESNGDLVVLIVRDNRPVTIMFRRSDQKMTPESMRVNQVIDLVH